MDAKPLENHCPFGCGLEESDEHGYCKHLVGFTNDGKHVEPIDLKVNGNVFVNGKKKQKIQQGDKLINPEVEQINNGLRVMAKTWVSARVYRKVPVRTIKRPDDYSEAELEALTSPGAA